jgi:predicted RNA-binding Zn-ribbon protein involved in translation (DUF1610 family)
MNRRLTACSNMNHRRSDAPVSHCPQCGEVVNAGIPARRCDDAKHAAARRRQSEFCVDCGEHLIVGCR